MTRTSTATATSPTITISRPAAGRSRRPSRRRDGSREARRRRPSAVPRERDGERRDTRRRTAAAAGGSSPRIASATSLGRESSGRRARLDRGRARRAGALDDRRAERRVDVAREPRRPRPRPRRRASGAGHDERRARGTARRIDDDDRCRRRVDPSTVPSSTTPSTSVTSSSPSPRRRRSLRPIRRRACRLVGARIVVSRSRRRGTTRCRRCPDRRSRERRARPPARSSEVVVQIVGERRDHRARLRASTRRLRRRRRPRAPACP